MKKITSFLMLVLAVLFAACKKDNTDIAADNIYTHPTQYLVYIEGAYNKEIIEFTANKKAIIHGLAQSTEYNYSINSDTLKIDGRGIEVNKTGVFERGELRKKYSIFKKPQTNVLAGKVFAGTYYRFIEGCGPFPVLHQKFFYQFDAKELKESAGFLYPTVARTQNYTLIANVAARAIVNGAPNDNEWMIWTNEELEVQYREPEPLFGLHYNYIGSFAQQ